jgi:hypothetical protein
VSISGQNFFSLKARIYKLWFNFFASAQGGMAQTASSAKTLNPRTLNSLNLALCATSGHLRKNIFR